MVKSWSKSLVETATSKPAKRNRCKFMVGNLKEKTLLNVQETMRRKHWNVFHIEIRRKVCGVIVYDLGEGPVAESCEHGNEISDSKKRGHFLSRCSIISF
jgi:hypothetical protein